MCGLIGFSGPKKFDPVKIKMLLLINEKRGEDACGFYSPQEGFTEEEAIRKETTKISDSNILKDKLVPSNLFIGHTRKSTDYQTKHNIAFAHPFHSGDIIGAHNGKVDNYHRFKQRYNDRLGDPGLDSKLIFDFIDEFESVDILGKIEGGTAVIYTDLNHKNILNIYRNEDRDLFHGKYYDENGEYVGMYISSIENSLEIIGCTKIEAFRTDYLYKIFEGKIDVKAGRPIKRNIYTYDEHRKWEDEEKEKREAKRKEILQDSKSVTVFPTIISEIPKELGIGVQNSIKEFLLNSDIVSSEALLRSVLETKEVLVGGDEYIDTIFSDNTVYRKRKYFFNNRNYVWEDLYYDSSREGHFLVLYYNDGGYMEIRVDGKFLGIEKKEVQYAEETRPIISSRNILEDEDSLLNRYQNISNTLFEVHSNLDDNLYALKDQIKTHGLEVLNPCIEDLQKICDLLKEKSIEESLMV